MSLQNPHLSARAPEHEATALLVLQAGSGSAKPFLISSDETLLGRLDECDLVLEGTEVSRHHAKITHQGGVYFLEDLKSLNGTYVNQVRCRGRRKLFHGDVIQFASASGPTLKFELHGPQPAIEGGHRAKSHIRFQHGLVQQGAIQLHVPRPTAIVSLAEMETAKGGVDAVAKLGAVLQVTSALANTLDLMDVLDKALEGLFRVFPQAQSGYVLLRDEAQGPLAVKVMRHRSCESATLAPLNRSLAEQACNEQAAILCSEAGEDDSLHDDEVGDFRVRSFMCAPLVGSAEFPLGAIQIDATGRDDEFTHRDLDVLASLAVVAGQAVENCRLHESRLQLVRRERELALAREVQLQFLPRQAPQVAGYDFCEYYSAADEVAGDFFDYVPLPNGRLALVIGDVCGKGISAALLMARICATARWCLHSLADAPAEAVRKLNDELLDSCVTDRFVSLVVSVLDPSRNEITIVNAGHPAPLLWRHSEKRVAAVGSDLAGMPLGIQRGHAYQQFQLPISAGDSIVCYTDGVSEAMSPHGDLYGAKAIAGCLSRHPRPLDAMHEIIEDVRRFSHNSRTDDICLLAFGRLDEARRSTRR